MKRLLRAVAGVVGFLVKLGLLLAVAGLVAALALWQTVDSQFRAAEVSVPDVRGLGLEAATARLAASDLALVVESRRPHGGIAPGLVAYQEPLPGASTRRQRAVRVTLSSGHELTSVPLLMGRSRREATILLRTQHITIGDVVQVTSGTAADTVLAQRPAAGSPLPETGRVDLLVSAGPRRLAWVMPDLVGVTGQVAREVLMEVGLRIAHEREADMGGPPGMVIDQQPPPGTRITREDAIVLTLTRAASRQGPPFLPAFPRSPSAPFAAPPAPAPKPERMVTP